ncbi:MAG: hypothetical protein LC658_12305 [Bacteroidales bacterium]|nr:hypothetical protein [Bacteroidales bacterium]
MKRFKIFGLITALVLVFSSCETEVIDPAGLRGEGVVPGIEDFIPQTFDILDLNNTFIQFTVVIDDPKVNEVIVLASVNGDKRRTEITRVSSFPGTVKLMLSELASKLGMQLNDVKLGDTFNIELQTIQDGKTYFSSAAFNAGVVCAYDSELVTGSYRAVSAGWAVDGNVTITADPDDEFVLYVSGLAALDGLDEDKGPLRLEVNELNFDVIAVKTVLASSAFGYTNIAYAGSGKLNTCDGTFEMLFTITVDQGSFGAYDFVLTKN